MVNMVIESLGENKFVFYFSHDAEKRRVILDGPWNFNNSLIVIEEPKEVGDIAYM